MNERLLAVCASGGIGDLLAATPAIRAIARRFGTPLSVLASAYTAPVLQDNAAVADVLLDDGAAPARDLAAQLRPHAFSHAVVFWSTARIAGALKRAGIGVRVGQSRRLYSWQYTTRVGVRTESGDRTSHWTDVQMDYARALGAVPEPGDFDIEIHLREENEIEANALLAGARTGDRFVVLHAARGLDLGKVSWPVGRFAQIGDALCLEFEAPVVLTGSASDARAIAEIGKRMLAPHAVMAGQTTLMGLAALLGKAALVVALDSGPMHIAAALGAPTVGIFALRTDLPDRWRPLGPRVAVVRPSYPCPPWHRKETCRSFACYAHLDPSAVIAAARSIVTMRKARTEASTR